MSGDVLGLVVVGVGIAGGVRIKDILKESTSEKPFLPNVKLVGFVSRFVINFLHSKVYICVFNINKICIVYLMSGTCK